MAYVVARPKGRWEIRESVWTGDGPRARTLVSFSVLTEEALERAGRKAQGGFDRAAVASLARRRGVPIEGRPADRLAGGLVGRLAGGERIRPGLRRLLLERLTSGPVPDSVDDSFAMWIGTSAEERGAALIDLLGLVDRLPKKPAGPLRFPRLSPERLR